jgi:curli biogenesis system outer membrane secretion channel CsgG
MRVSSLTMFFACLSLFAGSAPRKMRVAVFDFDNPPAQTTTVHHMDSPWIPFNPAPMKVVRTQVGQTISDLLVNQLVSDGKCQVIERQELKRVIQEQNLTNSDRVDPATAARIGRILGVDAMILGSVTRYDGNDRTTGRGHSYPFHESTKSTHDIKADVEIAVRVVSPDTAEIEAVAEGTGEAERNHVKEDNGDAYQGRGSPLADVEAEATKKAVADLAAQLEGRLAALPPRKQTIEAVVADASPTRIVINAGSERGVKVGDHLEVWRLGKAIRDPESGRILRYDDQRLGDAVVTDVDAASAGARYIGAEPAHIGDRVTETVK